MSVSTPVVEEIRHEDPPDGPTQQPTEQLNKIEMTNDHENHEELATSDKPPDKTTRDAAEKVERKKEDDKLSMYKALAIKLKKELVKCRDELQNLRDVSEKESGTLKSKVEELEETLASERLANTTKTATLEASIRSLKGQLDEAEQDLHAIHIEFEAYKTRATKIMQQNNSSQSSVSKTIEEERYKQLRALNEEQKKQITRLESQLEASQAKNLELDMESKQFKSQFEQLRAELEEHDNLRSKCESLTKENNNLKVALRQFRTKFSDVSSECEIPYAFCDDDQNSFGLGKRTELKADGDRESELLEPESSMTRTTPNADPEKCRLGSEGNRSESSPSVSIKDDSQTNSSSSNSSSAFVHIKPSSTSQTNAFEVISGSSVTSEDAQSQIDNLTKAYMDSERTNALLSNQVRALKEEVHRIQRANERMDLVENLEYLKNVMFKFLSLDSNQHEQKQRLVPVLSTVLKLSPDETAKLNSLATPESMVTSMASSFFKL